MNENYIVINTDVIREALQLKMITKMKKQVKNNKNLYYALGERYNAVLINVKGNNFILIDEIIKTKFGEIYLAKKLQQYTFTPKKVTKIRERMVWNVSAKREDIAVKQMYIERMIISYMEHGRLCNLPSHMHVHHKAQTWDHRASTIMYVDGKEHTHRNSHVKGIHVETIEEFENLIETINNNNMYYSRVTKIS